MADLTVFPTEEIQRGVLVVPILGKTKRLHICWSADGGSKRLETTHLSNFVAAIRSRKAGDLAAEALHGHHSTACCHLANISYRLGRQARPGVIRETIQANRELADAFDRCREYLRENDVNLDTTPAVLGPWITFDPKEERFVNDLADQANALSQREYRQPFAVPKIA